MGVKVTFLEPRNPLKRKTDKPAAGALVPASAIHGEGNSKYVFVVKDNTLERRAVTIGGSIGSDTEVLGGLQPDAVVVVKGPDSLHDGQAVRVEQR